MKYKTFPTLLAETATDTLTALKDPEIWTWSSLIGILLPLFKTYVYADFQFLVFLTLAMLMNTVSKGYLLLRDTPEQFSVATLFGKVGDKIFKYGVALVCVHIMTHFTINGEKNTFFDFVTHFFYGVFIVMEVRPTIERLGFKFPEELSSVIHKFLQKKTN